MGGRSDLCGSWIGTTFAAKHWLSLDVCGLFCVSLSCSVHLFALLVIWKFLIAPSNLMLQWGLYFCAYVPGAALALSSLFMAWTTDPGAVPMGAKPLTTFKRQASVNSETKQQQEGSDQEEDSTKARGERRCHKCMDNYKPPRAHHDSVTGRCIVKFDHYCPWVGNAVGALNHKFFVLFIGYTCLTSLLSLVLLLTRFVTCSYVASSSDEAEESADVANRLVQEAHEEEDDINDECLVFQRGHVFVLILLITSVVFLIFTFCMLLEQIDAISENTSKIARMKQRVGKAGTELSRVTHDFNEMFGGSSPKPTWHWFLPLSVKFQPPKMRSVILGYEEYHEPQDYDEENPPTTPSSTADPLQDDGEQDDDASQHSSLLVSAMHQDQEPDLQDSSPKDPSLMASSTDTVHLGTNNKKKQGMFKRRMNENPKFVDGTKDFT